MHVGSRLCAIFRCSQVTVMLLPYTAKGVVLCIIHDVRYSAATT